MSCICFPKNSPDLPQSLQRTGPRHPLSLSVGPIKPHVWAIGPLATDLLYFFDSIARQNKTKQNKLGRLYINNTTVLYLSVITIILFVGPTGELARRVSFLFPYYSTQPLGRLFKRGGRPCAPRGGAIMLFIFRLQCHQGDVFDRLCVFL